MKSTTSYHVFDDSKEWSKSWSNENTVVQLMLSDPDNLHPTNGLSQPRAEIFQYTQRSLLYIDYRYDSIIPGLVKSLPLIDESGLKYTYELRDDVKWDDGSKLTSDDIIFTAKAFRSQLTNDPTVRLYWENIESIIADPPNKFTIVMKKKLIQNITFLTGFAIMQRKFYDPENILAGYSLQQLGDTMIRESKDERLILVAKQFNDDKNGRDITRLNGLGMYSVSKWEPGQYITLVKKKDHWSQKSTEYHEVAYPEKIIFSVNKEEASQVLQFRNMNLDVSTSTAISAFLQLNSEKHFTDNYNSSLMSTYNYTYVCFNERPEGSHKKLFDDARVRRAIACLIPVDEIIKAVYRQFSDQCKRSISNVSPLKREFDTSLKPVAFDVSKAQQLLKEADWNDSDNDGMLDKLIDGVKTNLTSDLYFLNSSPEWKVMATIISENLWKAGIKINPVMLEFKVYLEKAKSHDFDLLLGSWGGSALPEDYTQLWHTSTWKNHGNNYPGFGNAVTDSLIDAMKAELDEPIRIELSRRLQKYIYDDQPMVFLYCSMRRNIIHRRFGSQAVFAERPGILINTLRLLSINNGITMKDEVNP